MKQIKGKKNTAICYAVNLEPSAEEQIRRMCDSAMSEGSRIRIMPDAHAGKGCTIGTTMTITDKVVPCIVGVDLSCGMFCTKLKETDIDLKRIDEACHIVPSGTDVWNEKKWPFDFSKLRCYDALRNVERLEKSLGTLGGGNHFIEIDKGHDGTFYLVIHSGSRNLGTQVAEHYQRLAIDHIRERDTLPEKKKALIKRYKAEGREKEIQNALETLAHEDKNLHIPDDLCYLEGELLDDYLHDVVICQAFARESRERMAEVILSHAGLTAEKSFHTVHNYIDADEMILRKGAVSAKKGEIILIPINARDGAILAKGKGNPEWNFSAPHGAGRVMSRNEARKTLSVDEYEKEMKDVYSTSINQETIDESPMAYRPIEEIIDVIRDSADIIEVIKPVFSFKA
jgi:RNA-splicing ligase RtcB